MSPATVVTDSHVLSDAAQHLTPHTACLGQVLGGSQPQPAGTGAAAAAACGSGGRGVSGASKVNLLKWLRRANRCVQPKESFWIFCEVLLLLDRCHTIAGPCACGLRPSKLLLFSNGRVAFTPPPPPPSSAAAIGNAPGAGGEDGGCADGRKKRRRQLTGQVRAAGDGTPAPPAAAHSGEGLGGGIHAAPRAALALVAGMEDYNVGPGLETPAVTAAAVGATPGTAAAEVTALSVAALPPPLPLDEDDEDSLYCSPEESEGQAATPASDMFSLGLLFFELFYVYTCQERAALLRVRTGKKRRGAGGDCLPSRTRHNSVRERPARVLLPLDACLHVLPVLGSVHTHSGARHSPPYL